ncbi:MAG: hypothetical protein ACRDJ4_13410 [Actinomycetota bacterium]
MTELAPTNRRRARPLIAGDVERGRDAESSTQLVASSSAVLAPA